MATTVTLDKAGRLVVPKPMRDALHLKPGATLEIVQEGDSIVLHEARSNAVMKKKNGFWVFDAGGRITTAMVNQTLAEIQEERDRRLLGE
ncbi:MAG: AbrB/MazE/SpoVT family DNA-binding domain-containing protein [Acidobacteriaceae bacterium]